MDAEAAIQEIIDRETRAWNTKDVPLLLSVFHPEAKREDGYARGTRADRRQTTALVGGHSSCGKSLCHARARNTRLAR
jgi:hypothetical protein